MYTPRKALLLLVAPLLGGCTGGARGVVSEYLDTKNCDDRAKFVLQPERWGPVMKAHYADNKDCVTEHGKIDASKCDSVSVGEYCYVSVEKIESDYCVKRTGDKDFKVDWPCSTGWNPTSTAAIKDKGLKDPALLRGSLLLTKVKAERFPDDTYFSVLLTLAHDSPVHAFARRESAAGKALYTLLEDGKPHFATALVAEPDGSKHQWFEVVSFVPDNWYSLPEGEERKLVEAARQYMRIGGCCDAITDKFVKQAFGSEMSLASTTKLKERHHDCQALIPKALDGKAQKAEVDAFLHKAWESDRDSCELPDVPPSSAPPVAADSSPPEKPTCDTTKLSKSQVRMGATTVNGRLAAEEIQRTVREKFSAIRDCYDAGRCKDPKLEGRVAIRFVIDGDGKVTSASNGGSDLPDPGVIECVKKEYLGMTFPKPESGNVTVVYPIMLPPGK